MVIVHLARGIVLLASKSAKFSRPKSRGAIHHNVRKRPKTFKNTENVQKRPKTSETSEIFYRRRRRARPLPQRHSSAVAPSLPYFISFLLKMQNNFLFYLGTLALKDFPIPLLMKE